MLTWNSLIVKSFFNLRLLIILVNILIITCNGLNNSYTNTEEYYCPFIETISFGSDINVKCNHTYLQFNEINNKKLNWKFANQSSFCQNKEKLEGFVNQCNITQINSKYLKVSLKASTHREYACVYCQINYKPIAPIINVTQYRHNNDVVYTFNLTATGLDHTESFEILWAKRAYSGLDHSHNYWFLKKCISSDIKILNNTNHSIIFTVDDVHVSRVEFIIRRCSGTCRVYQKCSEDTFNAELSSNNFQIPDSIEKIVCNSDCLKGIIPFLPSPPTTTTTTTTTAVTTTIMNNHIKEDVLLSTIQLSKEKQTIKYLILFSILSLLIVLSFIMLGYFLCRITGLRTDNTYIKTSNINLDENKENVE